MDERNKIRKIFSRDYFELSDNVPTTVPDTSHKQCNDKSLMGSISHRFVDTVKNLNSQYDYYKLDMAKDEIVLLQVRMYIIIYYTVAYVEIAFTVGANFLTNTSSDHIYTILYCYKL